MRAASLTGYVDVARFVGLDGRRMLLQAGLSPGMLEDPENRFPATAAIQLLERSAREASCESFGLQLAECRSFASLGPVSLLLERLPNVREVVNACIAYQRHLSDVVVLSMEDAEGTCLIGIDLAPGFWGAQMADLNIGIAYRVLAGASGNAWKPACVHLKRPEPSDLSVWRRFFSCPVEFDSGFSGFSCTSSSMLIPNPLADQVMADNARRLLSLVAFDSVQDVVSERTRRAITLLLPSGQANIGQVAAQLGLSPRSLQRRLDDEGHRFAELLDGVRRELATSYLASSARPITMVAELLGYASPSSFTRWFASTFGVSPQDWRTRYEKEEIGPPPIWRR